MARMLIVVGDALQAGGSVLTGSPHTDIDGRAVARIGDRVICARHGPGSILTGDATLVIDGQPVARHGDKASCGCALLAGKQQLAHVSAGGAPVAAAPGIGMNIASAPSAPNKCASTRSAPPSMEEAGAQCWLRDHDMDVADDVDGRYYVAYDARGDKLDYSFPVSYRIDVPIKTNDQVVVSIEVKPVPMLFITEDEVAHVKKQMTEAISMYWNDRFNLEVYDPQCGTRLLPIRYEIRWVDGGGDYKLFIHREFEREQVAFPNIDVSVNTTPWTYAHEFAHCIGVPDEYSYNEPDEETVRYFKPDGTLDSEVLVAKPDSRELSDPDATMMNAEDCGILKPRHAWNIAREVEELLSNEIGRRIECSIK